MIRVANVVVAWLVAAFLVLSPLKAQEMPQPGLRQVPLTQELVRRFMSSFPKLLDFGKKYESSSSDSANASTNPSKVMSAYVSSLEARNEMQRVLSDNGFKDFGEWTKVATSVALAYGYAKSGKTPDELAAASESAVAKIRDNPNMPDAQKQQMITMMRQQMAQMAPLPGNLEVAKSLIDELKPVMEME